MTDNRGMPEYKPDGYTSVAPYLIVDGAADTIAFLQRVFGAVELRRFGDDHERLVHGEVRIDDTVVMVADSAGPWTPTAAHVHVYVPDVDAAYRRALEAGATSLQEPVKKADEDTRGGVKDPRGVSWWIATKVG